MTPDEETLYTEAEQLGGFSALSLKAQALWAHEHRADKAAMRISTFVWQRSSRAMAKAVMWFPAEFDRDNSADELISLFTLCTLSQKRAKQIYFDFRAKTLRRWQVKEYVDELRPKPTKVPQHCPNCGFELKNGHGGTGRGQGRKKK